jgi:SAM-dependent methyltransferase
MIKSDEDNLLLVESAESVDQINAGFYGRFPYPWPAAKFDCLQDPNFNVEMLNQELGDWSHSLAPPDARIWVAGCGVNQAVITALRFPKATVLGSDLSSASLDLCAQNARALGVANLELRQESLNQVAYREEFDYVICTGVIHHNADPAVTLNRISGALKPSGILELMVYNRFHWVIPVAFQQAIRRLCDGQGTVSDFECELSVTRSIIKQAPASPLLRSYLSRYSSDSPESMLADELLQPVIYSYTVDSLKDLAASCNLELLRPSLNQFDKAAGAYSWELSCNDPVVSQLYEALPDTRRWEITNFLLLENSPMLWFYLQRSDASRPRKSEHQVCEEFLDTVFIQASTLQQNFIRTEQGQYVRSSNAVPYPVSPPDATVRRIFEAVDGFATMREIFERLRLETGFRYVNNVRLKLTTPAYPYLKAAPGRAQVRVTDSDLAGVDQQRLAADKRKKFKGVKPKAIPLPDQN